MRFLHKDAQRTARSQASAFRRLWGGTAASNLADGVIIAAAPLLAASLTRDPLLVSGIVVAQQLPWVVFTLFAGFIVDRADRRKLLVGANVMRALALGLLVVCLVTSTENIALLYLVLFGLGLAETIIDNAALAVLPGILDRELLERANGRIFATQSVLNELVGPPLGGALFAVSAVLTFASGSVAFAVAAAVLALLPRSKGKPHPPSTALPGMWGSIAEGLQWFWANKLIRTVAIMAGVVNLFGAATLGVLVLVATSDFGLDAGGYGLLLTGGAVGGIIAGLVADRLIQRFGSGVVIVMSNLLPAIGYLVLALTYSAVIAGLALALVSFAGTVGNVVVVTLRQASVPDHLLGRVASAYRLVALGALPLGGILGGLIATAFGLRAPFYLGAGCLAVLAVVLAPILTTKAIDRATGKTGQRDRRTNG